LTLIVIFITLILLYTLVSRRLERTNLTAPIVFTGAGMLALLVLPSLREQQGNLEVFMKASGCC
jgi:TctA family transporter